MGSRHTVACVSSRHTVACVSSRHTAAALREQQTHAVPVLWRVQGSYLYPDKSLYTGGWKAGKKHGQGEAARLGSTSMCLQSPPAGNSSLSCKACGSLPRFSSGDCIGCQRLSDSITSCAWFCATRHLLGQCWRVPAWQLGVGQPQGAGAVRPATLPL